MNINNLHKKGVICYFKDGNIENKYVGESIIVNPDIYLRGCNVNKTVLACFENSGWKEYLEGLNSKK